MTKKFSSFYFPFFLLVFVSCGASKEKENSSPKTMVNHFVFCFSEKLLLKFHTNGAKGSNENQERRLHGLLDSNCVV